MKDITSSVYNFEDLIQGNFLYVDKTEYIWQLIRPAKEMYFLSRPRRFGKSLTVSTLKAVFEGKKELFKGLAIYDKPYDWKPYPVIHLSFGDFSSSMNTPEKLTDYLNTKIIQISSQHQFVPQSNDPGLKFGELIDYLAKQNQVVILVDEYDKPILDNISTPQVVDIQKVLKGFYSVLKDRNASERFLFLTGVSKFSHVSLFSDLNNLTDITMDARYATMFGYTQQELENSFEDRIETIAKNQNSPIEEFKIKLKEWYNGYRFHANSQTVYNPVSIAKFFESNGEFNNYWFSTGTPSFLLELAKKRDFDFERVLTNPVQGVAFSAYEIDRIDPLVLLLQTGYLTIKSTTEDFGVPLYQLDFPNQEVATAFNTYLLNCYTPYSREQVDSLILDLARAVRSGDANHFMELWQAYLADIPYDIQLKHEKYYQTIFYTTFRTLGYTIKAESRTNKGRIDAVVSYGEWVYVLEFKLDKNADIALDQIKQNRYYQKYMHSGKRIILIGANFDFAERQLTDWKIEEVTTP